MSSFKTVSKRSLTQGGVTVNSLWASAAVPCPTGAFDNTCNANGVYAGCYLTAEYADDRYLIKAETLTGITQPEADMRYVQLNEASTMTADLTVNGNIVSTDLTVNGDIMTASVDAPDTALSLGAVNASSVTIGSSGQPVTINGDVNFKGALEFNDASGSEGQVLTIEGSAPVWKTPNFDARYVQLNAASTMTAELTADGNIVTPSVDSATALNLGTVKATSITVGRATVPIMGAYVCTQPTHLANKQYVDSAVGAGILPLTNVWTGTSNKFNNKIITNVIESAAASAVVNLYNNLTTGHVYLANSAPNIHIGELSTNVNIATGVHSGTLTLGTSDASDCGTTQTTYLNGDTINIGTTATGNITMGGASTLIQLGEHTQQGNVEIRTANVVAIGNVASAINMGGSMTAGSINLGNSATPITGPYVCTQPTHLANKQYVDSTLSGGILPLTNVWTGASNTFTTPIIGNTIQATAVDASVNLYTNLTTGKITIGNNTTPIIGPYVCTQPTHLTNKQYVDAVAGSGLLTLTNVWTGASNTFNNKIMVNTIEATAVDASVNLFNNVTTGTLNIGTGMTTGFIFIGKSASDGGTRDVTIRALANMNLGNSCATVNLGMGSTSVNIGTMSYSGEINLGTNTGISQTVNVNGATLNMGNSVTTGGINIGTGMTTAELIIGNNNVFTGPITLRTLGVLNLGSYASSVWVGRNSPSINIGIENNFLGGASSINIGTSSLEKTITIGNSSMTGDIVIDTDGNVDLGSNAARVNVGLQTDELLLGANMTTGAINIGTALTTGSIQIGNNAQTGDLLLQTAGELELANFAANINMGVSMTTGDINIGSIETTTSLNGATVNVGTTCNVVNIGNEETTTNISGSVTISSPIIISGTTYPITNTNCIGYEIFHEIVLGEFEPHLEVIDTITLPYSGVYIFNSIIYYEFTGLPIYSFIVLNGQGVYDLGSIFSTIKTAGTACMTQVVTATAGDYTLSLMAEECVYNVRGYFKAVRIA